ncbi:MAG: TIGR04372 family glycosyltransferase [Syntrophales bacterium]
MARIKHYIKYNVWENIQKTIRTEGVFSCLKKALFFIIGRLMGLLAYPVCRMMNVKFIPVHIAAIGHLAGEIELYVKEGALGLRPLYKTILFAYRKNVANPHLLSYWKKYVYVIENPVLCFLLGPLRRSGLVRYHVEKYFCGDYSSAAYPTIQGQYHGRSPVLSLTDFDRERGWSALRELGVPKDPWFVCVHCREGGSLGLRQGQMHRDVDINSYLPAMEEITRRGGWVIRMGDAAMKPIPVIKNVIDYAHLDIKSDWMDVFLCASCKFYFGSNSGLLNLSSVFGVSNSVANIAGPFSAVLLYGPEDIGIPKLLWSLKENRYLSFREILSSPVGNFREDYLFAEHGIRVVDNSPEDIKAIAMEMLDRLNGKIQYSDEDERMQEDFKSLMNPSHFSYGAVSRVGRDFLRKYKYLLYDR